MSTEFLVETFTHILIVLAFLVFTLKRMMTYMHAYQQEDYDGQRLKQWIFHNKVFDKRISMILLLAGSAWFLPGLIPPFLVNLLVLSAFALGAYLERDPRFESKKKLVMTPRAVRITATGMALAALPAALNAYLRIPLLWIVAVQLIPWLMLLGNACLAPFEKNLQKKFWAEAHEKLLQYHPIVIGITGSFGKTSVKHILGHILKMQAKTLITPGSVNTPMGVARILRENLEEDHKYLIVEMGAYGPGSIERLCKLAPPDFGIITAVGHAHYERFKSLESVAYTKYELAQAVIAKGGKLVVNEKTLLYDGPAAMREAHKDSFILCGKNAPDGLTIQEIKQTAKGLEVTILWEKESYVLKAPLYGIHHGENMAYAFAAGCALGLEPATIIAALHSTPQIAHRLEVKLQPNGATVIDDAFNSNPLGFRAALDLLESLSLEGKRSILITPGMVEMGALHDDAHRQIGALAAEKCDILLAVQPARIPTFIEGFESKAAGDQTVHKFDTFAEAQKWVGQNMSEKDVILIENDLPDVYERIPKL